MTEHQAQVLIWMLGAIIVGQWVVNVRMWWRVRTGVAMTGAGARTGAAMLHPVTGITLALLPLAYMVVYAVLFRGESSEQLRTVVVTSIVNLLLGALAGYWFKANAQQQTSIPPLAPLPQIPAPGDATATATGADGTTVTATAAAKP